MAADDIRTESVEMLTFVLGLSLADVTASSTTRPAQRVIHIMAELERRGVLHGFMGQLQPEIAGSIAMAYQAARTRVRFGG